MKQAYLERFGNPASSVELRDVPEPDQPAGGQLLVRMLAAPINPAELLLVQGRYASRPPLPVPLGIEAACEVLAIGAGIGDVQVGDRVISLTRTNWAERLCLAREEVIVLPASIDPLQAGMLKVNPATALMMLQNYRKLGAGDWLVQNAANSGVGRNLIQLASAAGVRTACVVRRESLRDELLAIGATAVFIDGPDLAGQVRNRIDGPLPLAIDAVGGTASMRLAACLDEDGMVVNYGLLSGEPCQLAAEQAIFNGISLRGFWLAKQLRGMEADRMTALYAELSAHIVAGRVYAPVERTYPLTELPAALDHAMREGRSGKILLTG